MIPSGLFLHFAIHISILAATNYPLLPHASLVLEHGLHQHFTIHRTAPPPNGSYRRCEVVSWSSSDTVLSGPAHPRSSIIFILFPPLVHTLPHAYCLYLIEANHCYDHILLLLVLLCAT
ncbi:hypothetical protein BO83DRAFT_213340 [Aspergillus eucalypticola CBS 122712]|uniref:Secreted protein n=1 Tax=Aspergillus eucalypticola (strain CBS 122712 / IBT 29274) TaxID=1448314 RepID=A0A317VWH9_ASPEC|nr:uncharacterized protein BO83DRAFT_213340 [Aspergillus eucalypticola CBS 122712]PWY78694.1 hypothetical protein BO83DRAFT_213340 [Aspergillus eucalypticola CBS 122712]